MPDTLLIINPVSGKGRGKKLIENLERLCRGIYKETHTLITEYPQHACQYINSEGHRYRNILAAGGDGTINEVVNGKKPEHDFRLTILPIGSGNDFARMIKLLGKHYEPIIIASRDTEPSVVDIAELKIRNKNGTEINRKFHSSCGSGFDACVSKISNRDSVLRGLPLYLSSVFTALYKYTAMDVEMRINEAIISGRKLLITCGNTQTSGGGFKLTPKAQIDDGLLDIMVGDELQKRQILGLLPRAIFGRHLNDPRVKYFQSESCHIKFMDSSIVHADGEIVSEDAVELKLKSVPKFLKITRM